MTDAYAHLKRARDAGALILANERRHGRPDTYHVVRDPEFSCPADEYLAVVPWADSQRNED